MGILTGLPVLEKIRHLWHKRRPAFVLTCAALLLVLGWGVRRWRKGSAVPPSSETVSRGDIESRFKESGDVAPKIYVDVASKVSGRVLELKVEEGQTVVKGQALAVIQPGRTEAERFVPSTLTAPIAGIVMRYVATGSNNQEARYPRVGDYVTGLFDAQNPTYLMTIADLSKLVVRLQISEMDILKLHAGMPVSVTVDALPGQTFQAKVGLISPQAEKNNAGLKVFKVEVDLDGGDKRLKPGMTARVDALLEKREKVLKVPLAGVFEDMGKTVAFVSAPEPRRVEIELGLRGDLEAELIKGDLAPGDKLLTDKPAETAQEGWFKRLWAKVRRKKK